MTTGDISADSDRWAYQRLRLAYAASVLEDEQFTQMVLTMKTDDLLDSAIDDLLDAEQVFRSYSELMTGVLERLSITLEQMSCHPD